jgi:hypothetical protein
MALLIRKSNGFIKINKFSYPAIYHILDWSLLVLKATIFRRGAWNAVPGRTAARHARDASIK